MLSYQWLEKHLKTGFKCQHCGLCCGIVICTREENRHIGAYVYDNKIAVRDTTDIWCPYHVDARCLIYPVRPYVCRMMGYAEELRCFSGNTNRIIKAKEVHRLWSLYRAKLGDPDEAIVGSHYAKILEGDDIMRLLQEKAKLQQLAKQRKLNRQFNELDFKAQVRLITNDIAQAKEERS